MTATLVTGIVEKGLFHHTLFNGIVCLMYCRKTLNLWIILQTGFTFVVVLVLAKFLTVPNMFSTACDDNCGEAILVS